MARIANNWALPHIAALAMGERVAFRPKGGSMTGIIESGDLVTVSPITAERYPKEGDVLVQVGDFTYVHLIKQVHQPEGYRPRFLIGNNRGRVNGWVERGALYGIVTEVLHIMCTPSQDDLITN